MFKTWATFAATGIVAITGVSAVAATKVVSSQAKVSQLNTLDPFNPSAAPVLSPVERVVATADIELLAAGDDNGNHYGQFKSKHKPKPPHGPPNP